MFTLKTILSITLILIVSSSDKLTYLESLPSKCSHLKEFCLDSTDCCGDLHCRDTVCIGSEVEKCARHGQNCNEGKCCSFLYCNEELNLCLTPKPNKQIFLATESKYTGCKSDDECIIKGVGLRCIRGRCVFIK